MNLLFGLIGQHLSHSFSQGYFTEKFKSLGIRARYQNFEMNDVHGLYEVIDRHPELVGFNVTIPFKETILPLLHDIEAMAEKVGAVNTVLVDEGKLYGFNTDVIGFRDSLNNFYQGPPGGHALVLGNGGAAKAVLYTLEHYFAFDQIDHVSRQPLNGQINYDQLDDRGLGRYRLLVNCTPVGMYPDLNAELPLAWDSLQPGQHLYDLIYNPVRSRFLEHGLEQGCYIQNGLDMLRRQAEAAWDIWKEGLVFERR